MRVFNAEKGAASPADQILVLEKRGSTGLSGRPLVQRPSPLVAFAVPANLLAEPLVQRLCVRPGAPPPAARRTRLGVSRCTRRPSPDVPPANSRMPRRGRPGTRSSGHRPSPDGRETQTCVSAPHSVGRSSWPRAPVIFRSRFSFVYFAESWTGVVKRLCSRRSPSPPGWSVRRLRTAYNAFRDHSQFVGVVFDVVPGSGVGLGVTWFGQTFVTSTGCCSRAGLE